MIVLVFVVQACANTGQPAEPPHLRRIGPEVPGGDVVLRYGDRLEVTPPARTGGWRVTDYPAGILRLDGGTAAAPSHTFVAIAVGQGQVALGPSGEFAFRVHVLRDLVQAPQP